MSSTVYVLHGWTYNTDTWAGFIEAMKAKGFLVSVLSIPGLTAPMPKVYDIDDYVDWLSATLPKSPVVLMGHSFGGKLAIAFAARYPKRVSRLILESSSGVIDRSVGVAVKKRVLKLASKILGPFKQTPLRPVLYKLIGERDYLNTPNPIIRETMARTVGFDCVPLLPDLTMPALVIWGQEDRITPVWMAEKIASKLSAVETIVIPGARHTPHHTHAGVVTDQISSFLRCDAI